MMRKNGTARMTPLNTSSAVERAERRRFEPFFVHGNDEQIGFDPLGTVVAYFYFHGPQVFWRIKVMNSLRVSWRVRKAPSRLLVIT